MLRTLARRPKRFLKRTVSFLMGAAVVLLYHRVYDTDFDPLLLSVSPDNFDAQMTYLRRRYALLSLEELRGALGRRSLPRGAVAIRPSQLAWLISGNGSCSHRMYASAQQ